jgi:anthranilate/para-aminobenzoate synthase component I
MQIINEIEPTARGIYTGSIGYIGLNGSVCSTCHGLPAREDTAKMAVPPSSSVCLNIAIRTIIIKNNTAYVQTGGGIVADSNSQAEYEETIIKAQVLLAGIAAVNR